MSKKEEYSDFYKKLISNFEISDNIDIKNGNVSSSPSRIPFDDKNLENIVKEESLKSVIEYTDSLEFKDKIEKNIEKRFDKLDDKIENSKLKTIETLGIFIGLFTFISVEFQIFRRDFDLAEAAGLSMIILGGMLLFINFMHFFIINNDENDNKEEKGRIIFFIASLALITAGIILFTINGLRSPVEIENYNKDSSIQVCDDQIVIS